MIRRYLESNILIADGAMGTYYSQLTGKDVSLAEFANKLEPEVIRNIHREYINAGARLIRTNTFSANSITLGIAREEVAELIREGYAIAQQAVDTEDVFVAACIGPVSDSGFKGPDHTDKRIFQEYKFIVDVFLELGADIFLFETLSGVDYVAEIAEYVKENKKSAFVLTQFTIVSNGYTRKGIRIPRIIKEVKATGVVDAYGFNCGVGPTLLYNSLKDIDFSGDIVSVLPNAGYPQLVNERTVYAANSEYFSDRMVDLADLGAKIIGGCCGTTPIHIKKTAEKIRSGKQKVTSGPVRVRQELASDKQRPSFGQSRKHMVAVELDPPFDVDLEPIMRGAGLLRDSGVVDFITVADSPLARVRVDSIMVGAKIKREFGIETIPHICCRDRNVLALKSGLLGAHMEGIRNLLIVTGDPVSAAERIDVKSVFNLNSVKLMKLISEMNRDVFAEDPFCIGGALNLNVRNKDAEVARMYKKIENGATFFLTQPIFADETIEYLSRLNKEGAKIFAGIMPIVSYRNAQFLNNEIPGIHIPQSYIDRFSEGMSREDAEETGIEISTTIASKVKDFVDGFYFITPFNRVSMISKILQRVLQ